MIESELRAIAKELRLLGASETADKVMCALAAVTDAEEPRADLSYTYIMRELRKTDDDKRLVFQKTFKEAFDRALDEDLEDPSQVALMEALEQIEKV